MSPKLKRFIQSWLINTLAVLVAVLILPGIRYDRIIDLFAASLLLGVLNTFVRPILFLVALPLVIFTLGLFWFVINALMLYCVGWLLKGFQVDSFWWAFGGALVISIVSLPLNLITGTSKTKLEFRHHHDRRPPGSDPGGSGPVIDV